ncbi:hypothetical protein K439DRAFT_274036 [Ramaria rubella]|nr:hypothetical protein K439DRAFT_274036 [Ramaria rubella]
MSHFHEQVLDIRSVVLRQSLMTLSEWNPCLLIRQTSGPIRTSRPLPHLEPSRFVSARSSLPGFLT